MCRLEYGCSYYKGGYSPFVWRFPIAFQIFPLLVLFGICWLFPESPRYLAKVGRGDESRYILGRLRGETGADEGKAENEYQDILNIVQLEKDTAGDQHYYKVSLLLGHTIFAVLIVEQMLFGIGTGKLHTGRRVQLVIWLQIMQEWIGIAGVTLFSPTIFRIAGIANKDSQWIAGLNTITYTLSTLICVFTLDRIGRRWTLYWGSVGQAIALFLAGGLCKLAKDTTGSTSTNSGHAAVAMVFLFTIIFGATWLTV